MTPRYMLDTDSVSYALRGHGNVGHRIVELRPSELCISALTEAELRFGADKRRSARLHHLIDAFTAALHVAPFDKECAASFGKLATRLAARGRPIGAMDALIASHAMSLGLTLVTNNERHFRAVDGLKVENWT